MRYPHLDYLRTLAILSIVFFHTTGMMYANHFPESKDIYHAIYYSFNQCYLVNFAMLVFTALSGYLFAVIKDKGGYTDAKKFIIKKAKRLLLPFAVFTPLIIFTSTLNSLSFTEQIRTCSFSYIQGSYSHLWYLTGLFWCFLLAFLIYPWLKKSVIWQVVTFALSFAAAILLSNVDINFLGLLHGARWFYFFFLGMLVAMYHNKLSGKTAINILLLILTVVLCLIYPLPAYSERTFLFMVIITISIFPIFYLFEKLFTGITTPQPIAVISKYSYGIYIFHNWFAPYLISQSAQRIFHLAPLAKEHTFLFPMVFFIVTLLLSLTTTYLFQKTKVGRYLLG